jgi:hypothetical protein
LQTKECYFLPNFFSSSYINLPSNFPGFILCDKFILDIRNAILLYKYIRIWHKSRPNSEKLFFKWYMKFCFELFCCTWSKFSKQISMVECMVGWRIMQRKLKHWWSTIPPISPLHQLVEHKKEITAYDVGNTGPGLELVIIILTIPLLHMTRIANYLKWYKRSEIYMVSRWHMASATISVEAVVEKE